MHMDLYLDAGKSYQVILPRINFNMILFSTSICIGSVYCVWSMDLSLNMLRLGLQGWVGVGGDHDQIGSGRDVNEVRY